MKNSQRFYNEEDCLKAIKIIKSVSDQNGMEDFNGVLILTASEVEEVISQFEIAQIRGGKYFPNIISEPHFSADQIDGLLGFIAKKEFTLNR